jgi:hypothetical protein
MSALLRALLSQRCSHGIAARACSGARNAARESVFMRLGARESGYRSAIAGAARGTSPRPSKLLLRTLNGRPARCVLLQASLRTMFFM